MAFNYRLKPTRIVIGTLSAGTHSMYVFGLAHDCGEYSRTSVAVNKYSDDIAEQTVTVCNLNRLLRRPLDIPP